MNILDMRTVVLSYVISNLVCASVMVSLWFQYRRRFAGLGFWLVDFILQVVWIILIALRGILPDFASIIISNILLLGGTTLLFFGLERYFGKTSSHFFNTILLVVFIGIHLYFTLAQPNLQARNLNITAGLLVIFIQCAWLMLRRVEVKMRPGLRGVSLVFVAFSLTSIVRMVVDWFVPQGNDFFKSGAYDTFLVLLYQVLYIGLTFSLVLMVNGRLFTDLTDDITQRKQAEDTLRESEERYRSLFENMLEGFAYCQMLYENGQPQDFIYLKVNDQFEQLTGLVNVTGKRVTETIPGVREANPELFEVYGRVALTGRPENFETYLPGLDTWFSISVYSPQKEYFVAVFEIITARKKAEETLRLSEERFRLAAESLSDVIYEWDLKESIQWFGNVDELLGYAPGEFPRTLEGWTNSLHPQDRQRVLAAIESHLLGEAPYDVEYRVRCKDGDWRHWLARALALRNGSGQPYRWVGAVTDVTERKQYEAEIVSLAKFPSENPYPVLRIQPDGMVMYANQAARELLDSWEYPGGKEALAFWREVISKSFEEQSANTLEIENQGRIFSMFIVPVRGENYANLYGRDITERKQVEKALRESEEFYHRTLDHMLEGCQILGLDWQYLYINDAATKHNRRPKEELLGKKYMDMWPGIENTNVFSAIRQCMEERTPFTMENEFIFPDSSKGWFDLSIQSVPDGVFILSVDVTERKRAEEALRESEDKFKYVFDNSVVGKSITLPTGEMQPNRAFCELVGYSVEELQNLNWRVITAPDDIELTQKVIDSLLSGEKDWARFIKRYIRKDGSVVWADASTSMRRDPAGKPLYLMTTLIDITERIRAEEETHKLLSQAEQSRQILLSLLEDQRQAEGEIRRLNAGLEQRVRERTAELSDLYNNAPCGYHSLDENGVIVRINDTELSWLGYSREEILGKRSFPELLTPASVRVFKENFPDFKQRGWLRDLELEVQCKDGSILPISASASAKYNPEGQYQMSRSMIVDLTERRRAEAVIREYQSNLETANKELESFSYSVSHDLRAPLRGIDGWSQALLEDYYDQLDETARQYLNRVRSEAQRMGILIDDLLQFSRVTRAGLKNERVDLSALAQAVVARLQEAKPGRPVEVTIQPSLAASGDPALFEILLTNLLNNAWKFTASRPLAQVEFGQTQVDGRKAFYVRDNGVGFDMAYHHKLFGVFQRLHKASEFPGTGIGLATVQRIVQRFGGQAWAEAKIDQGATFYFTIEEVK